MQYIPKPKSAHSVPSWKRVGKKSVHIKGGMIGRNSIVKNAEILSKHNVLYIKIRLLRLSKSIL